MARILSTLALLILAVFLSRMSGQTESCAQGMQMFKERRWSEAAADFEQCERADPGKTDALLFRGKSLVNLREFDDAARVLRAYAKLHPQSEDAAYLLGYILFRQDKPEESLKLFSEAGKLKPPSANDLMIIALDYVLLNDYPDPAHYLESSLQMNPNDVETRYHLGRVRYQQNQFDLAIAAFREVFSFEFQGFRFFSGNIATECKGKNSRER